jgi:CSLREA domain-containing protein
MSLLKPFKLCILLLGFAGAIFVTLLADRPAQAENSRPARVEAFTINDAADAPDANPGDGLCETAPGNGQCSLRAAIQEANA